EGRIFADTVEAVAAFQMGVVDLHAKVKVRGINQIFEAGLDPKEALTPALWKDFTTVGRVMFNEILPKEMSSFYPLPEEHKSWAENRINTNNTMGKKELSRLVEQCYKYMGHFKTVVLLDDLKRLGFHYATMAGLSISITDMKIPPIKKDLVAKARQEVRE